MDSTPRHPSPAAPHRLSTADRKAMTAILLAVSLASLDTAIANTALPTIAANLRAAPAASIWVVNAYQLTVVAALLPCAALGDRLGPRRVYLGGLLFFIAASLACALAATLPQLIVARALKGLGAAALMSVNIALVRMIYPAERLGRGVGLNALVVGLSLAAGPTLASLVLAVGSWPWLFAINLPLGLVALAFALPSLPRSRPHDHPFDLLAAGLTASAFASLVLALGNAAQREPWPQVAVPAALALLFGALQLRRQAGHPAPMLPVDLLRRPLFTLSAVTALAAFATQGLAFVALPFYFEGVLHRNAVETGFLLAPWAIVVALAAPIAGRLSDRYPAWPARRGGAGVALRRHAVAGAAAGRRRRG